MTTVEPDAGAIPSSGRSPATSAAQEHGHGEERTPTWRIALPGAVLAAVLALVGLGRTSLWLDESLSLGATNQLAGALRGTGGTMAAYYAFLTPWSLPSEAAWWLRLPSVAFAIGSLLPTAAVARRIGGDVLAGRACIVTGASFAFTRYAQEARSYALVMLLTATAVWVVLRGIESDAADRRWWRLSTVLALLLVLSHGLALLIVGMITVALAVSPAPRRALQGYLPAAGAAAVTVAVLWTSGAEHVGAWVAPIDGSQVRAVAETYGSPAWWAMAPLIGIAGYGAVTACRAAESPPERWLARLPTLWAALPVLALVALSIVRPSLIDRYLIGIVPAVGILWAQATIALDRRLEHRRGAPGRVVGPGLVVVLLLLVPGQVSVHQRRGDDWRGAAAVVATESRGGDALVFPQQYHRTPFEAAWATTRPDAVAPTPLDAPRPLGEVRRHDVPLPSETVVEAMAEYDRVWVVAGHEAGSWGDPLTTFLERDAVAEGFETTREVVLDGRVTVLLLEAR